MLLNPYFSYLGPVCLCFCQSLHCTSPHPCVRPGGSWDVDKPTLQTFWILFPGCVHTPRYTCFHKQQLLAKRRKLNKERVSESLLLNQLYGRAMHSHMREAAPPHTAQRPRRTPLCHVLDDGREFRMRKAGINPRKFRGFMGEVLGMRQGTPRTREFFFPPP